MSDLNNEADVGSEDVSVEKPLSIRDSIKAAMEETDTPKLERDRDEGGRFAKASEPKAVDAAPKTEPQPAVHVDPVVTAPTQIAEPTAKAPPGWSAEAKASFNTLPAHVQAAVAKREQEVDNGFRVLQEYKGLEEFTPLLRQNNTTYAEVMRRAIGWEHAIQTDPVNAVMHAARIAGLDITVNGRAQQAAPQQFQQQQPNVEQTVEHVLRKRDTENQISAFINDPANAFVSDSVLEDMATLIKTGRANGLKDAYEAACWLNPDIRTQLISKQVPAPVDTHSQRAAVDQARKASRSITGTSAPGPSANGGDQPTSIRDSLKQAFAAAGSNRA
jgi:hypothetical protein